jgi:hypothetical protein
VNKLGEEFSQVSKAEYQSMFCGEERERERERGVTCKNLIVEMDKMKSLLSPS